MDNRAIHQYLWQTIKNLKAILKDKEKKDSELNYLFSLWFYLLIQLFPPYVNSMRNIQYR